VMQQQLGIVSMDGAAFDSIGDPILLGGAVFGAGLPLACSGLNIVAIGSVTSEIVEIIQRELVWLGQIQESKQTDAESEEIHRPDMRELIVGPILASIPGTLWPIAATVSYFKSLYLLVLHSS
jgi:Na+/H+-translocating membrane pyrophosphatase